MMSRVRKQTQGRIRAGAPLATSRHSTSDAIEDGAKNKQEQPSSSTALCLSLFLYIFLYLSLFSAKQISHAIFNIRLCLARTPQK